MVGSPLLSPVITALQGHQLVVAALLLDAPLPNHHNSVRPPHRAQLLRHDERRAARAAAEEVGPAQPLLHRPLRLLVQQRRRLVQQKDLRVAQQRPGDRDALLLAAGQLDAAGLGDRKKRKVRS